MAKFTTEEVVKVFSFLDSLRETGVTNMFGAGEYVTASLGYPKPEASKLVAGWMDTFDGESTAEARADTFITKYTHFIAF